MALPSTPRALKGAPEFKNPLTQSSIVENYKAIVFVYAFFVVLAFCCATFSRFGQGMSRVLLRCPLLSS
jgi:hypothetical protein